MFSDTTGWALADSSDGTYVVRTTDGGHHWSKALDAKSMAFDFMPSAADFHSASGSWVLGVLGAHSTASRQEAMVVATADGGAHWTTVASLGIDGQAKSLQFVGSQHGWVFATPSAGGVIGAQDTTLYRTLDGGRSWQIIKPPSQVRGNPPVHGSLPEACQGPLDTPSFVDALNGWIAGPCNSRVYLFASHDGGLKWSTQTLPPFPAPASEPNPPSYATTSPRFISAADGTFTVARGFTTGANLRREAAMYVTHDAGRTWTPYRLPRTELRTDFLDPQRGWFVGLDEAGGALGRYLYATSDGGQSWHLVAGPQDYFDGELSFVSQTNGFIAVQSIKGEPGQFLKTTDGGATWTEIPIAVSLA